MRIHTAENIIGREIRQALKFTNRFITIIPFPIPLREPKGHSQHRHSLDGRMRYRVVLLELGGNYCRIRIGADWY